MMEKYKFDKIDKKFAFLSDKNVQKLLAKWDVEFNISSFNYDKPVEEIEIPKLINWVRIVSQFFVFLEKAHL